MAKCVKCKAKSGKILLVSGETVCKDCFCLIVEKRVLSNLRKNKILLKEGNNWFIDDNSVKSTFLKVFSTQMHDSTRAEVSVEKYSDVTKIFSDKSLLLQAKSQKARVFVPFSAEDEAELMLSALSSGQDLKNLGIVLKISGVTFVKPLLCLSEKEIEQYVLLKTGKKFKSGKKTDVLQMISELEAKYPGRIFGLAKSSDALSLILSEK